MKRDLLSIRDLSPGEILRLIEKAEKMKAELASGTLLKPLTHRGEEITGEVIEGQRAPVLDQTENRLHLQMALLDWMIGSRNL